MARSVYDRKMILSHGAGRHSAWDVKSFPEGICLRRTGSARSRRRCFSERDMVARSFKRPLSGESDTACCVIRPRSPRSQPSSGRDAASDAVLASLVSMRGQGDAHPSDRVPAQRPVRPLSVPGKKNLPAGVVVGGSGVDAIGQASNASDVDVAFDIAPSAIGRFSLVDQSRIRRQLAAALNAPVDFIERAYLRPRIADRAAADMRPGTGQCDSQGLRSGGKTTSER